MTGPSLQRRFCVHDVQEAVSRAHLVEGLNFEDAALHFIESYHPPAESAEVSLHVEDLETGERQCLRVDLESGDTAPCE